jgi:Ni/Co efflux regulator RcnB
MSRSTPFVPLALACLLVSVTAAAEEQHRGAEEQHRGAQEQHRPAPQHAEPHPGPAHYERAPEPHGWNARPATVDRGAYQHNFQAARSFRIGPYHRPPGWEEHRWAFGQILPRAYWAPEYLIADYWLFALEVPPAGYEWVRDGSDALLVNAATGEILQVEYGVFA